MAPISTSLPKTEITWATPDASLSSEFSPMNRSSATRILVFVSLSGLSNSSQPKRSCAFFIDMRPPSRGFRLGFTSVLSFVSPWRRQLFERARLPSGEHHGEFLNEAFPLSDDGCSVRLF